MRRREFILLLGGAVTAWPLAAHPQQAALPVVALITGRAPEASVRRAASFRNGLSETGYVEGRNVVVEYHWLEGHYDRLPALMADLVRRGWPDVGARGDLQRSARALGAWWDECVDEAYSILKASNPSFTPGFNIGQLKQDLDAVAH